MCIIDSYRFALGDFELAGDENKEYDTIFWLVFVVGTVFSLLIFLNMIIAVMGGSFEEVKSNEEAFKYRTKLALFVENYHKFPKKTQDDLKRYKYMISIEIDPVNDPIGNVTEMEQIKSDLVGIKEMIDLMYGLMIQNMKNQADQDLGSDDEHEEKEDQ